ncbi:hypothetical protein [Microcystis phage Mwe-JY13]
MTTSRNKLTALGFPPEQAKELADNLPSSQAAMQAIAPLTGTSGTTGNAIVDVTATYSQTVLNDNFRRLQDKVNAILAQLKA